MASRRGSADSEIPTACDRSGPRRACRTIQPWETRGALDSNVFRERDNQRVAHNDHARHGTLGRSLILIQLSRSARLLRQVGFLQEVAWPALSGKTSIQRVPNRNLNLARGGLRLRLGLRLGFAFTAGSRERKLEESFFQKVQVTVQLACLHRVR